MIVANTSPLINFAMVGHLPLLEQLFGRLTIPHAVLRELEGHRQLYPDVASRILQGGVVDVIYVRHTPILDALRLDLDKGEAEAIALAVEQQADLIILDEIAGRYAAEAQGLRFTGTVGCLVEAKRSGLITELRSLLDAMQEQAGFWLRDTLRERVLRDVGEWDQL